MNWKKHAGIYSVLIICMIIGFYFLHNSNHVESNMNRVNITNTNCSLSVYLGRKIFFHICTIWNNTVYDIRYFWQDSDEILKADFVGVQLNAKEYSKICQYCGK